MKQGFFPLWAKVLSWLMLHLLLLAICFSAFVAWQLGLGMDSLLTGAAGERLRDFGEAARSRLVGLPPAQWSDALLPLAERKNVKAAIFDPIFPQSFPAEIPRNVLERLKKLPPPGQRPQPGRGQRPRFEDPLLPDERELRNEPPEFERPERLVIEREQVTPAFIMRGQGGDGYWAGVHVRFGPGTTPAGRPRMLLIRSERLDGSGMFFDFQPWLWGGLAVLLLSLAFWAPFVFGITRYLQRLRLATEGIASGQFQITLPPRGNDELGNLGQSLETMAQRLDHLIRGQKRFLGDAAHELCAPLVRIRTGLSVLEMKLTPESRPQLDSIDADASELATLIEEILAFSRAGNRQPKLQSLHLSSVVHQTLARESGNLNITLNVPEELQVQADAALLSRAVGNLLRNAAVHAGNEASVSITASDLANHVVLEVTDNGPGVPDHELPHLFEPFYRPDLSRSRETGGSGLGLAIVRTAVEACKGEVSANLPPSGGFSVTIRLLKAADS